MGGRRGSGGERVLVRSCQRRRDDTDAPTPAVGIDLKLTNALCCPYSLPRRQPDIPVCQITTYGVQLGPNWPSSRSLCRVKALISMRSRMRGLTMDTRQPTSLADVLSRPIVVSPGGQQRAEGRGGEARPVTFPGDEALLWTQWPENNRLYVAFGVFGSGSYRGSAIRDCMGLEGRREYDGKGRCGRFQTHDGYWPAYRLAPRWR